MVKIRTTIEIDLRIPEPDDFANEVAMVTQILQNAFSKTRAIESWRIKEVLERVD